MKGLHGLLSVGILFISLGKGKAASTSDICSVVSQMLTANEKSVAVSIRQRPSWPRNI